MHNITGIVDGAFTAISLMLQHDTYSQQPVQCRITQMLHNMPQYIWILDILDNHFKTLIFSKEQN